MSSVTIPGSAPPACEGCPSSLSSLPYHEISMIMRFPWGGRSFQGTSDHYRAQGVAALAPALNPNPISEGRDPPPHPPPPLGLGWGECALGWETSLNPHLFLQVKEVELREENEWPQPPWAALKASAESLPGQPSAQAQCPQGSL